MTFEEYKKKYDLEDLKITLWDRILFWWWDLLYKIKNN